MKMRKWYVVIIALAVIAIAWGIGARIFVAQKSGEPASPLAAVSLAYYTNAKGQQWAIPTGDYSFNSASAETYPKFVLGNIDPVKVSIGDTQTMQIVVRDDVPLVKVWAEVENDKSTDSIPLTLGASSTVSYNTIQNQKYLVGNDGKLVINDGQHSTPAIAELIQSLFNKANAAQAVDYSYSGSWVVHDTRTITYHTTFYAMDAQGRTAKMVIAWSDPCGVTSGATYLLNGACNLTATWGVDGASLNLNGQTLNMSGSANLVYNSGKSLIFTTQGSTLNIGSGTQTSKHNLYFTDNDGDGWAASTAMNTTGGVRVESVNKLSSESSDPQIPAASSLDCNDNDSRANPGDSNWWASQGNSGWTGSSGDFNCNGTEGTSWNLYNSTYQASGYPGLYHTSAYDNTFTDTIGYTSLCYWSSGSAIFLNTSPSACGSVYSYFSGSFYSVSGVSCGSGSVGLFYGSAVEVCR